MVILFVDNATYRLIRRIGGANEAVIRMLISIGSPDKVPEFLERVKRRETVLSGFGHR